MVEFIIGASGTGKTTAMFDRIWAFSEQGKWQIILVPEQFSTEFDKKLYFRIGAKKFNELLSLTFSALARQLFQLYGEPDRKGEYADDMARLILIYQAVRAAENNPQQLSFFGKRCRQNGFAEEIMQLISDMKRAGVTPQRLLQKAELMDPMLRDKTADIAEIYCEYEFLMEQYGFKDHLENMREAAKIANLQQYFKGAAVCLDEFESFTADQLDMMKVIFSSAEHVVITLRTDDVNAGEFTLFETVNSTYRRLAQLCRELNLDFKVTRLADSVRFNSPDLKYLSENIMRDRSADPENAPEPRNIRIFEARDMYAEAEYVCAELKRLIHGDKSLKYRDIAIISNSIESYAEVLRAAFERYDIPYFMSIERPVNHTAVMVYFLTLLDLIGTKKFRSEQIFRLLKCGLSGADLTEVSVLENYCYKWGIDGNVWCSPFTAEDESSELLEQLRSRIMTPLMKLKRKLSADLPAEEACRLLYDFLIDSGAEENLGGLMNSLIKNDRDNEAGELKRLWGCLMDILDSTADTLKDTVISFGELSGIMRSMIGRLTYSVAPQTLDAVMAASARTARLSSPRVIFVMGASEGDLPNQVSLHGLFSEGDKQKLSLQGIEIARPLTDLIASERLIVYKALSTASDRLYLTYPLSDLSGQVKYPARIIDSIMTMFRISQPVTERDLTSDFYAVTMKAAYYRYMQDRANRTTATETIGKVLLADPVFSRRVIRAKTRSGAVLADKIPTQIMEKLKSFEPLRLSPTGMENYNKCHFMYFCQSVLRLMMPDKVDLDLRAAGDIIHNCFCSIMGSRRKSDFITLSYDRINEEIRAEAERYRADEMAGDFAKTPRFELFFNKLTERLAAVFMHTQQALMVSDFVPDSFEADITRKNSLRLGFAGDKTLTFGGIIDRADVCEIDGKQYLRIVDYKSSSKTIDEKTLAGGLNLQMLLYLFAATDKGGIYEGYTPAGVLYSPITIGDVKAEESKENSFNQAAVDDKLKTTGLLIDSKAVLEAMEHGIGGRFIPAKINKSNGAFSAASSVISQESVGRLRELVYGSLAETAESLYSGNIEAIPLNHKGRTACAYCAYGSICGNGSGKKCREPDSERVAAAAEILGKDGDR